MGGRWLYNCFVRRCFQDLFKTACGILAGGGNGLCVNANKTESMCYQEKEANSTLRISVPVHLPRQQLAQSAGAVEFTDCFSAEM